jgi:class 3 adenylate cyclase
VTLGLLAAVIAEAVVAIALLVLWRRARATAADLQQRLDARRWLPTGRDAVKAVLGTAARVREQGVGGALRSSIEDLAGWAQVERPDLVRLSAPDGTVTIAFSDIEDSTALNEELGDRSWVRLLGRHEKAVRRIVDAHGGQVVKSQGDGFMIAFAAPAEAVASAVAIQRATGRTSRPSIRVRIGVHCGPAVERAGDLFGRNVAFAARVAGTAAGGQILVSEPVRAAVPDLPVDDGREVELKGVPGRHRLYAVSWRD